MNRIYFAILILVIISCNQASIQNQILQNRMDSLEIKMMSIYKPGFGEFMSNIQTHHAKLWFAGINENWKLADFEIHEITETMEAIQKHQTERKESEMIGILSPAIDSVNMAIAQKNEILFKSSYNLLTNTCNSCHHATNFDFNVVKIPDTQIFSNQEFTIRK